MSRIVLLVLVMVWHAGSVGVLSRAETHVHAAPVPHMAIEVQADRVLIGHGGEFMPRDPNARKIQANQVYTPPADSTETTIEVQGTLKISRAYDTTLRFVTIVILPGGRLDVGTETDPILRRVTFIIRDQPFLPGDSFQWSRGIVNFGTQTRVGVAKTAWTELLEDVPAGAMSIRAAACDGWQPGDEVLLPDMQQPFSNQSSRREAGVAIAGVGAGCVLHLSKPLDFEHESVKRPDGSGVLKPRIANLSRNIVIRSENPLTGRGHTADVGPDASWDIRYNEFVGVGRTKGVPTGPGNQIGRYADHKHHAQGFGSKAMGSVYRGTYGSKWAIAVHQTHDTLVEDNVCIDFQGGCYVTEDGPELRNVFRRNVAAYSLGNSREEDKNTNEDCAGCKSAFWMRGVQGMVFVGNEAWANYGAGINLFNTDWVGVGSLVPSQPGGELDTPFDPATARAALVDGNVDVGNIDGLELWGPQAPIVDHISAHSTFRIVYPAPGARSTFVNLTVIGNRAVGKTTCVASSAAYVPSIEIDGGEIRGCEYGFSGGFALEFGTFRNLVLQNEYNIEFSGHMVPATFTNVRHEPLPGYPKKYFVVNTTDAIWQPGQSINSVWGRREEWLDQQGSPWLIDNHNGTGQTFRLLAIQQHGSHPAWHTADLNFPFEVPLSGLTMRQAWAQLGMAFRGYVYEDADVIPIEGIVNGVAVSPTITLGPKRLVVTYPNANGPAVVQNGAIPFKATMTGPIPDGDARGLVAVDGGALVVTRAMYQPGEQVLRSGLTGAAVTPGTHTMQTWRVDASGNAIASSALAFCYWVEFKTTPCGDGVVVPPPPPTDSDGDGVPDSTDACPGTPAGTVVDATGCAVPPPPPPPTGCAVADADGEGFTSPDSAVWRMTFGVDGRPDWAAIYRNDVLVAKTDWSPSLVLVDGNVYQANYTGTRWERWRQYVGGTKWIGSAKPTCSVQ